MIGWQPQSGNGKLVGNLMAHFNRRCVPVNPFWALGKQSLVSDTRFCLTFHHGLCRLASLNGRIVVISVLRVDTSLRRCAVILNDS
jgi:hypothetical protein